MLKPVTRADVGVLASATTGLLAAHLSAVTYRYLPPADESGYAGGGEGVDADLSAVVLDLGDRGRRTITWAMDGELHGISIVDDEAYSDAGAKSIEASGREAWRDHIGSTITSVGAAWQVSGDGCPESLWALRLDLSTGSSMVLALGTDYPEIDYMPDELIVLFDPALARAYHPPHVNDSAWGEQLEPV